MHAVSGDWPTVKTWETFLAGGRVEHEVRASILDSWRRSRSHGVLPQRTELPYADVMDRADRLLTAAAPVLERFRHVIAGSPIVVALTDADATVLHRLVGERSLNGVLDRLSIAPGFSFAEAAIGTNGIGTALIERRLCSVVGTEHFAEQLRPYTCAAAPICDPLCGRIEGVIDVTVPLAADTARIESLAVRLGREIENRLMAPYTRRELALRTALHQVPEARTAAPGPHVDPADIVVLQEHAARLISHPGLTPLLVPLTAQRTAALHAYSVTGPDGVSGTAVEVELPRAGEIPRIPLPATEPVPAVTQPASAPKDEGADRWLLLFGEQGVGRLAVAARERLRLLYEAGVSVGTTLDVRTTVRELAAVAVPGLADGVTVDLPDAVLDGGEPPPAPAALRRVAAVGSGLCGTVGELVGYRSAGPHERAYRGNEPVLESVLGAEHDGASDHWAATHGAHSMMCVPLRARGAVLGVAAFYRGDRAEPFVEDDLALAVDFVARAAVCIDNARRYTSEHATALALQRSLLPQRLSGHSAVEVSHCYLPAQAAVGGDWFDVIALSGARVALVVGDVVGHGLHATATMGRLRTAVHNFAALDLPPEEVLAHLDDLVNRLDEEAGETGCGGGAAAGVIGATCLYVVYDPLTGQCTLARAGHPPPALVDTDGRVTFPDLPAGPPLGLGGFPFESAEMVLPEGSDLVLFTDGLIERRHRDPDDGLRLLSTALAGRRLPAQTCAAVLDAMLPDEPGDDVAILVARTRVLRPDRVGQWDIPPDPAAVSALRGAASAWVTERGLSTELAYTTEIVLSELIANALRYTNGPVQLRLILDRTLICEVADNSSTSPRMRRSSTVDEGGRGLFIVAQLTQRWGTRYTPTGKVIWTELSLGEPSAPRAAG
ncbi:SpoIIE family protein phosphatase [Streptomyces sp. NPDC051976]|uniref:SpoIIE family protein phosphatase n=1 Tax=Streptomyces sp. NPDC051976 TaxID=3154947 RepID=UPI00342C0637